MTEKQKSASSNSKVDTSKSKVDTSLTRKVDTSPEKVFPMMIREGKLEKRFPFTHNHPEQGYKTSEEYAEGL